MKAARAAILLIVSLAPSAYIAWLGRDGPHLGYLHDDAIYWVCARSLAQGQGYRIASLPGRPFETKYPPLYPLLLSTAWRADPAFPRNLRLAQLLAWLMVPLYVWAAAAWLPRGVWIAAALNPFVALAGASLLSELPFSVLLMLALALVERARDPRRPAWLALAAGAVAAAAFLTRSVGLLLWPAAALAFCLRRQFRRAALFIAAMLPAVAGWLLWAHAHRSASVPAYYTDYLGFYWHDTALTALPATAWRNLDSLLTSLGSLLVFDLGGGALGRSLAWVLAAAALAGVARLARAKLTSFHLFTALYFPALVFWNYMPDQRFLLPVYPLLVAGLVAELRNVARAVPPGRARRIAMAAALGCLAGAGWQTAFAFGRVLPDFVERHRAARARLAPLYGWIRSNLPPNATLLAYRDPLAWLYTGRRAERLVVPPSLLYRGDRAGLDRLADSAGEYARTRGLSHALFTAGDLDAELAGKDRAEALGRIRSGPGMELLHDCGQEAVYVLESARCRR